MGLRRRDLLIIPALTLGVMALNVAASFAMVWAYSVFWRPGEPEAFYQAFAMEAAPVSSVVVGAPLMFAAALLVARGRSRRDALLAGGAVALLYIAIDLAILLAAKAPAEIWGWAALSFVNQLLAALLGAVVATPSREPVPARISGSALEPRPGRSHRAGRLFSLTWPSSRRAYTRSWAGSKPLFGISSRREFAALDPGGDPACRSNGSRVTLG